MAKPYAGQIDQYQPDQLVSGEFPRVARSGTIAAGQNLPKGAVLGRVTASGELKLSATAAGDGSEKVYAVLAEAIDTTGGAATAPIYLTGEFNPADLTFGTGHTAASTGDALRAHSIFLRATGRV
jgi:hypothetical protein